MHLIIVPRCFNLIIPSTRYADTAKMEQHVNRRERFHVYGYGIRFVLRLRIDVVTVKCIAPCKKNRLGNLEYDVRGRCFPNNLAGF